MGSGQTGTERGDRRPAALLPAPVARLGGFAALALLGVLQWQRMVDGLAAGRAVLWVLAAVAAAIGVLWAQSRARRPSIALPAVTLAALLGAYAASGLELALLKPARWDELGDGVARGVEVLGHVRLPYAGADPWPGLTLQLLGALLCVLAALVAFWPREREPGYPFLALSALLVLVASPVVSLGGPRQIALGVVLAALTVAFLWLERLPLRPGLGVAVLLALAVVGALPFASVADREEPWFDYKSFAEGLGPDDPLRFSWNHEYGPINWPREGNEVLRVATEKPSYWKVRNLEEFDGEVWRDGGVSFGTVDPGAELPPDWRDRDAWTDELRVTVRRMRTTDVVSAGTIVRVAGASRRVRPADEPGMWRAETEFRRGDSYTVEAHIPRPTGAQLTQSASGAFGDHADALVLSMPFRPTRPPPRGVPRAPRGTPARFAVVRFPTFREAADGAAPRAAYPTLRRSGSGAFALRNSAYARSWRLARRLQREAETPFGYVLAVDRFLKRDFAYDESPTPPARGRAPLDAFLFDSKSGYCQHFSGAMALLLRMGGIPARVVTGFSPGGYSERKRAWIVRDTDAHSWVEVWFDPWGWVTFDPTPESTPARSQIAALEPEAAPVDEGDEAAEGDAGPVFDSRGVREDQLRDRASGTSGGGDVDGGGPAWWWMALAAVAALSLGGWAIFAGRRRGRPELDRAVAELEAALRRSGRPAPVGTTLQQLEQRFGGSPEAMAYLRALRAGRYGVRAPQPTAAQRRALRRELASGLGASGWLRALWALPPWRA